MHCISANDLAELLEDRLPPARRAVVLADLERCDECRAIARAWALSSFAATPTATRPDAPDAGTLIGPFRIDALLGVGAMGLVFRGHDTTLERDVAVKLVRAGDAADRERALHEARLLATVRHPNVIAVHAAGLGDGVAYLAMELVDGTSLDRMIAQRPLGWRAAVRGFRGVAAGLAALHAAGVIHRDIKPANLLVDRDALRIADFGLATTDGGAPAGTRGYVAPEVLAGAPATAASDQFSLFVALVEAITGRRPFAATAESDVRGGVRDWTGIPARLRRVIARGLAPAASARWPDLGAVERRLAALTEPRRWPWVIAALAAAIVGSGAIALRARAPRTPTVPTLAWTSRVATAPAPVRLATAGYQIAWRAAYADTDATGDGARQRRCLARARGRVEAILDAVDPGPAAVLRALAELPEPARCLGPGVDDGPPSTASRPAEAARALGQPRAAWALLPPAPDDDAALALLRGQIAHELQDLPAAEAALRRAIELASSEDLDGLRIDAQVELAIVIGFDQDRHDAGAATVDAAVVTARRLGDRRRAASAAVALGLIGFARGDQAHAVGTLTAALTELEQLDAPPLERARAELRLGWVLREGGSADARSHLERARALRAAVLGPDHPAVAAIDVELGMVDARAGRYPQAIASYLAIIARTTAAVGADDVALAGPLSALGAAQLATGDYAGAEASFGRVLTLRRAAFGDRHLDVARTHLNLATTAYYQGKIDAAIEAYRAADATARSILGGDHPEVATIGSGLALALLQAGRNDEARTVLTDATTIYRRRPGHDRELADALMTLGMLELTAERPTEARAALDASFAVQRQLYGDDHVELAPILSIRAELELAEHHLDAAERLLTTARRLRLDHDVAPQLVAENEYVLALVAWEQGRRADARALARSARGRLGDARPDLAAAIDDWRRGHGDRAPTGR